MATDVLEKVRDEIEEKIQDLAPAAAEHARLLAAREALKAAGTRAGTRPAAPRSAAKPRRRSRAGRAKPRTTRKEQALAMVRESPGITVNELADKMGIKRNYLYRVMPALREEGLVEPGGEGYRVVEPAAPTPPPDASAPPS